MQIKLILAVLGATLLCIGVFSPFLTIPVAGGISLFNRGIGNGVILLILAGIALATALLRRWNGMWIIAGAAGGVLLYTTLNFYFTMVGAQEAAKIKLADNPFGGLSEALLNAVQISWGLPMMVIGVILLAMSAAVRDQSKEVQQTPQKPILPVVLGLVALIGSGLAGAAIGQQERTNAVTTAKAEAAREAEEARRIEEERRREEEERAAAEAVEAQARQDALNKLKVD